MKRIIATSLIIFIVFGILNNFFYAMMYKNNYPISINVLQQKSPLKLSIEPKDTTKIKRDTISLIKIDTVTIKRSQSKITDDTHDATWYRTQGTIVHRDYPTAAYNHHPKGTKLLVTNINTGDTCVVEVTDRMGCQKKNKIDLSHSAFGKLDNHAKGRIKVKVKKL